MVTCDNCSDEIKGRRIKCPDCGRMVCPTCRVLFGNEEDLFCSHEVQDQLKRVARKRDVSVSKLVRDMVDKFLNDNAT